MITPALLRKLQGHLIKAVAHGEEADLLARKAARAADHAVSEAAHVKGILGALARDLETAGPNPVDGIGAQLDKYVSLIRESEEHAFNDRRLEVSDHIKALIRKGYIERVGEPADIARNTLFTLINGATS